MAGSNENITISTQVKVEVELGKIRITDKNKRFARLILKQQSLTRAPLVLDKFVVERYQILSQCKIFVVVVNFRDYSECSFRRS